MRQIQVFMALMSVTSFYVTANYICVCNRDLDLQQYPILDSMQSGIGYLNPNVCVPVIETKTDKGWIAVNFHRQKGVIEKNVNIVLELCAGQNPAARTTTSTAIITTTSTIQTRTTQTPTGHGHQLPPGLLGNVNLCPEYVVRGSRAHGYLLTQHGHSCYEVCQDTVSWTHAHTVCTERGGHLVSIHNDAQNTYLQNLLQQGFNHVVWIGLHDREQEEKFEWTTGEKVAYTHWKPRHRMSANHTHEDCVLMHPNSYWDDVECGSNHPFHEAAHKTAPYICEYKAHTNEFLVVG